MFEKIKVESVELYTESPYIITINKKFQVVGAEARAYSVYLFSKKMKGVFLTARGKYHNDGNFIINKLIIPKEYHLGMLKDIRA